MERTLVNPWPWSLDYGFSQAVIVDGQRRQLFCSGQTASAADGAPQHAGDMRNQLSMALDNLEAVLAGAGMGLADVVRLTVYTTDVDETVAHFALVGARLGAAGCTPAMTLLGVTRLAFPELMVEIEATAAD